MIECLLLEIQSPVNRDGHIRSKHKSANGEEIFLIYCSGYRYRYGFLIIYEYGMDFVRI